MRKNFIEELKDTMVINNSFNELAMLNQAHNEGFDGGFDYALDEIEKWANNFLFIPRHNIKRKISSMRQKP